MGAYQQMFAAALRNPQGFWAAAAAAVVWQKPWEAVLDSTDAPFYRWFVGGELNTCDNAVDRHVRAGFGEQAAIIYDSPMTGTVQTFSYAELQQKVTQVAGALRRSGVEYGDRVIIYMPMVPEAVFGMLACARLGAVHSVVFGGFSSKELAARIDDAKAKFILSASAGWSRGGWWIIKTVGWGAGNGAAPSCGVCYFAAAATSRRVAAGTRL